MRGERGSPRIERAPKRPRAELHSPLEPADRLLRDQRLNRALNERLVVSVENTAPACVSSFSIWSWVKDGPR